MPLFLADLPPQFHDRIVCSINAAVKYDIPANIVLAVAEQEAGKPGQWVRNTNGTHDVGPMQFNTAYLDELNRQYGITAADVAAAGCYSYDLAAWRLRQHIINDQGDLWTKAANYHSRTPSLNASYRHNIMHKALKWGNWLIARFAAAKKPEAKPLLSSQSVTPPKQEEVKQSTVSQPTAPAVTAAPAATATPATTATADSTGIPYVPRTITIR